jgi:hypothetical protein
VVGPGANAFAGTLSQKLGFDVRPILNLVLPLIAGQVGKTIVDQKLDASGVAKLLQTERDAVVNDPAHPQLAGLVSAAMEAGDQAAALQQAIGDTGWRTVRMAPVAAMYLVASASPNFLIGVSRRRRPPGTRCCAPPTAQPLRRSSARPSATG